MTRDVITTLLELVGLLLVCVGVGVFVARYSVAGGLIVAGGLLIATSLIIARQNSGD